MEVSYYLVRFDVLDAQEDFNKMVSALGSLPGMNVIPSESGGVVIAVEGTKLTSQFRLADFKLSPTADKHATMLLSCEQTNLAILTFFRRLAADFGYGVFSTTLGSFLPTDLGLNDVSAMVVKEKGTIVFNAKSFKPIFGYEDGFRFYAQSARDQTIHIINPALLDYFAEFGTDKRPVPEFSYQVADTLQQFVAMHNAEIIPVDFYEYYGRNLKIINYSFMNIWRVRRKIFIKPFLFEYEKTKQSYEMVSGERAAVHFADKVRKGENLDTALKRIIREELKVGNDYVRAKVGHKVEFDRDREGRLIPRLFVSVYMQEIPKTKKIREQSKRGWTSLDRAPQNM
ncbi:hypothetical protein IH980_00610 [Patescibacteria group bacterium]|nr:hypothetical protein [Patescibacteria group bacterium]